MHGYNRRLIVKLRDAVDIPEQGNLGWSLEKHKLLPWNRFNDKVPGVRIEHVFSSLSKNRLQNLVDRATKRDSKYERSNLFNFLAITPPTPSGLDTCLGIAQAMKDQFDVAYIESGPAEPPSGPLDDNPLASEQIHHRPAPEGIDSASAWAFAGGDGDGVRFIDIEQGWDLLHEDLVEANIQLIDGVNLDFETHGCAVLGVVLGVDNKRGIVGIAPRISEPYVISEWQDRNTLCTADAIAVAADAMPDGGVILVESQLKSKLPVELEYATWKAIHTATANGATVIEPAGNGPHDLDLPENQVEDSGAIMVAAGFRMINAGGEPRLGRPEGARTNFGSRIDCHAHGADVVTTRPTQGHPYEPVFGGTSSAAAIIAGVAACIHGIYRAQTGSSISPDLVRAMLRAPTMGTESARPETDGIRRMPDLKKIVNYMRKNLFY